MPDQSGIQKKSHQALKILCQSHNLQNIKLKENGNFKMGNLALTEILSAWLEFFLNSD